MAKVDKITYTPTELLELMLRDQGIDEGLWMFQVTFGFGAINTGPSEAEMFPTAMVPVTSIGIARAPKPGALVVDASQLKKGGKPAVKGPAAEKS